MSEQAHVAELLPGYEVGNVLGEGASGVVFDGRHRDLNREVAIKQLHPMFGNDAAVRARFVTEARVLASLDHPHIVPVYDFVQKDRICLLVMEKLPGGTVWTRFTSEGVTFADGCAIALATCAALQFAHEHNVLHRDIKPENLLFAATGALKVTDFGIAKVVGGDETLATRAGDVLGTPAYMAPEQALAAEPSPATDVYATGIMLYELFSGVLPFPNEGGALAVIYRHVHDDPTPLPAVVPTLPEGIAAVVMKAIATRPEDRHESAKELRSALFEAAAQAWGTGWFVRTSVPVLDVPPVKPAQTEEREARTTIVGAGAVTVPPAGQTETPAVPPDTTKAEATETAGDSDATVGVGTADPARDDATDGDAATIAPAKGPTEASMPAAIAMPTVRVRPEDDDGHARETWVGARAGDLELVPVRDLIPAPALSPVGLILAALGVLFLMAALALVGLGSPHGTGTILPGTVAVDGVDPARGSPPRLDLKAPITVAGRVPLGLRRVRLGFEVLGRSLGTVEAEARQQDDGSFTAALDLSGSRFVVAGKTTARLVLSFAGQETSGFTLRRTFSITSEQPALVTVPGAAGVALLLFVVGYAESFLRCLRHGARKLLASTGLVLLGALAGVVAVDLAWVGGGRQPVVATILGCVSLGVAAGVVGGRAATQLHRRRQMRRRLGPSREGPSAQDREGRRESPRDAARPR